MNARPSEQEIEVLTCRASSLCTAVIGSTDRPVVFSRRILDDVRHLDTGCVSFWCKRCRKATEYRYLTQLTKSA